MLSDLTPAQITMLAAVISYQIYVSVNNDEANAINNLLALITSNLSVQLAQQALNDEENKGTNSNNSSDNENTEDITPLFTI